jgi:Beta-lactamase superfamily domain
MEDQANVLKFPKHFDGKRFYNPDAPQAPGYLDGLRWKLTTRPEPSPSFIADVEPSIPPKRVDSSGMRVTLVNHSTVLLQQRSSNILTDPIWSERSSPFSWIGPRRRREPGVSWENLPLIDALLVSHNHYDHMDLPTLRRFATRGNSKFIVPAGAGRLLRSAKLESVHELDWGESLSLQNFTVHCVPALHFSARGLFDRNKSLWCGYVIESGNRIVYFRRRYRVRTSLCSDSRNVRIAAPCAIAHRSVRTTLVHVSGAHGAQ